MYSELWPWAFQPTVGIHASQRAKADFADVEVILGERVCNLESHLIPGCLLNIVHHMVDAFFSVRQLHRARLLPVCLVLVCGFCQHFHLSFFLVHVFDWGEIWVGVAQEAVSQDGHHLCGVAQGDGEVCVELVAAEEPCGAV